MTLFDYAERYPTAPGFKARETSAAAAESMRPKAKRLQGLVLDALAQYGGMTADEIADRLQIDRLAIRPRLSELSALGKVIESGLRRVNKSGRPAIVWRLPEMAEAA